MDKNEFRRLMGDYLKGELSPDELELLQRWYDSFGESVIGVPGMENEETAQKLKAELDARIFQAVNGSPKGTAPIRKLKIWQWAAAILLIAAFSSVLLFFVVESRHDDKKAVKLTQHPTYRKVNTGIRQIKKLSLPDGSIIHLNANSTIRVPTQLGHHRRAVFLDEGEAYFEIARDSLRPFTVQTQALRVEVLGTAFNVKSYKTMKDVTVAVQHGRVQVSDARQLLGELSANKGLIYRKEDGRKNIVNLKSADVDAWIGGIVHLEKAVFEDLAQAMYNLYGVHLKSKDPRTAHNHYNMTLRSDRPLNEVMAIICNIHRTNYRRKGDEITIYP
ncbi:MAG TPA: FecR domain-containing protein [Pseudosphingobacterium sp.]|nr:FecR domain-containing protein [Pseudosphingobacterium sp.]